MKQFLFVLFTLLSIKSGHTELLEKKCVSQFRVTVNSFAPLFVRDQSGKSSGLSYDLLMELSKRSGCSFVIEPSSFPRAFTDLSQSRSDFYAFGLQMDEWKKFASYDVLYTMARVLIVNRNAVASSNIKIDDILKDKKIKFADTIGSPFFLKPHEREMLKAQGRLLELTNPEQAYDLLRTGRVQAMFSSPAINKYYLDHLKMRDDMTVLRDAQGTASVGLYSSKRRISEPVREIMRNSMKELYQDGTLKEILSKYLEPEDIKYYYNL